MSLPPMRHERSGVRCRLLAVTVGGLGDLRPASGTWGSLPPVVLAALLLALDAPPTLLNTAMVLGLVAFSAACVFFGDEAEARYHAKDPSPVVADETAGQCLALLAFPATHDHRFALLVLAFLAFRMLDIIKPPPARNLQRVRGGWGILLDDLIAGAMTLVLVQIAAAVS